MTNQTKHSNERMGSYTIVQSKSLQSKLATSEVTFAAIFRPNFAVSELEKILLSSDDVDEFCNYKLESSDIFFRT